MSLSTEIILSLTEALESSINLVLKQEPATLDKFSKLQGKVIAFELSGLDLTLYLFPHTEGVQVKYLYEGKPDTTLQGSPLAFINMSLGDATESIFSGDIRITGDIELGQRFKRILDHINLDWEEWLAAYSGDLIAYKTGDMLRSASKWGINALKILEMDAREYIQEEGQLSPHSADLTDFTNQVSQLRDQTARLEARILRLQEQLKTTA